jgi:uncharacterized protein
MVIRTLALMIARQILDIVGLGSAPEAKDVGIAVLRHQLLVCRQQVARPRYTPAGRMGPHSVGDVAAPAIAGQSFLSPRNAHPRDELGRPLPHGAAGVEPVPDDLALSPEETLAEAQRLLDAGRAFQAHEVLESTWKAAPEIDRERWRGLAQLAVGLTHAKRGDAVGAVDLLRRAADRVEGYADPPHRVDAAGLVAWARALMERIEKDGLPSLADGDLTPRLRS